MKFVAPVPGRDGKVNALLGQTIVCTGIFPEIGGGAFATNEWSSGYSFRHSSSLSISCFLALALSRSRALAFSLSLSRSLSLSLSFSSRFLPPPSSPFYRPPLIFYLPPPPSHVCVYPSFAQDLGSASVKRDARTSSRNSGDDAQARCRVKRRFCSLARIQDSPKYRKRAPARSVPSCRSTSCGRRSSAMLLSRISRRRRR